MNDILREDIENILKQDLNWEKFRSSNILITGASGMVGGYMMRTLCRLNETGSFGMNIYVLVRHPEKIPEELKSSVNVIKQSVIEPINSDVEFDFIIHWKPQGKGPEKDIFLYRPERYTASLMNTKKFSRKIRMDLLIR